MTTAYTPMVQQYLEVKEQHKDELLFFRLGDFYELFFEDAMTASQELNLTLTGRAGGLEERIPMCGVPYHSVDKYLTKLVRKGYRIAICEQVEDPKSAKGIVKREVIKIITPGTALNAEMLEDSSNQYLICLQEATEGLCLVASDISTGQCQWLLAQGTNRREVVLDEIFRLGPAEIICSGKIEQWEEIEQALQRKLPQCVLNKVNYDLLSGTYFEQHFGPAAKEQLLPLVASTVELLLQYVHDNVKADLANINQLVALNREQFMNVDATAIRNLELLRNMRDGGKRGSLLSVLDFTQTAMGIRQLRQWIENPLMDIAKITARQQAVRILVEQLEAREGLREALAPINDLERILTRLEVGSANARDLVALRTSLTMLPKLQQLLQPLQSPLLQQLNREINCQEELLCELEAAIVEEPPFTVREGGMIKTGYDLELDELHAIASDNKTWMQNFEQRIKAETGIKTMKVSYNKVFGYYIEVSKGQVSSVPDYFIRKQTLVNAERYIVPELKEFENKILSAKEKIQELEYYLFNKLRERIRTKLVEIQSTARALGCIDVLLSFALAAIKNNYICPQLNTQQEIIIKNGRHPVVEKLLERELFVPNDTVLNSKQQRMIILTGPNMAGKSTFMRQVALLVLMTQLGSFIPATEASICPVDRIFTRVGASDDLATGQSTFMVEMNEVAQILKYATHNSLIILDEVGRGTSTYDGMSIARAVIEYINTKIKAKTLFATHYHQLIALEEIMEGVKNFSVAVKERGNEVVFLRRIIAGGTDKSYGVHVARLAGLPKKVLERAEVLLREYDSLDGRSALPAQVAAEPAPIQSSLFDNALLQKLLQLDVMSMSPIEALNVLYKLQEEAKREGGQG